MLAGFGSLQEVQQRWSLHDLVDAHVALDFRDATERAMMRVKRPKDK